MRRIYKSIKIAIRILRDSKFENYVDNFKAANVLVWKEEGNYYIGEMVYLIGLRDLEGCERSMGFCALLNCVLHRLAYADRLGMRAFVHYPNTILYYEPEMKHITENAWEYYFEPISELKYDKIMSAKNLVISDEAHSQLILNNKPGYLIDEIGISELAKVWTKYVKFNSETKQRLYKDMEILRGKKKILGVHIRGTDFNNINKNHPVVISLNEYILKIQEVYKKGDYTHIFIATDEDKTISTLRSYFKENELLYFKDALRSVDGKPIHKKDNNRRLHKYLLGYEIIRDVYALSECEGFIAGRSQVSISARILKMSNKRQYEELYILDKGMHS